LKQTADVATAFWTLVIAIHTFCLICLGLKSSRFTLWMTLIAGWSGIGAIVIAGPAAQYTPRHEPFCQSFALIHRSLTHLHGRWHLRLLVLHPLLQESRMSVIPQSQSLLTPLRLDYMFASLELSAFLAYVHRSTDVYGRCIQLCAVHPGLPSYAW
jgi:hypothetical protein